MTARTITLSVTGIPKTQGNKTPFIHRSTGKAMMREGRTPEATDKFKSWRSDVARAARDAFEAEGLDALIDEPVLVHICFTLLRPPSHPKTKPTWPTGQQTGDIDKLQRACFDALTGTLLRDDGRIVGVAATKEWGDPAGVTITVETRDSEVHHVLYEASVRWLPLFEAEVSA